MNILTSLYPVLPYIVAALVLYIVYRMAPQLRLDDVMARLTGPSEGPARAQYEAARLSKQGNHLMAGKVLEEANLLAEAAEMYLEGRESFAAASVFERLGKNERAAEHYLQSGDHKKAAQMFAAAGKHARAAVLFVEKGNTLEAARMFAAGNNFEKAAELYDKAGYPQRAAEAWEKRGDLLKAAEAWERHFVENVSYGSSYSATAASPDQKSAHHAGRLYAQAGEHARAQEAYIRGGYHLEAAEVASQREQFAVAAELFLRAEEHERAAQAYERAGDVARAANLRGEVALKADRVADAAAYFVTGRDYLRAAELFESIDMMPQAARAYESGESWAAAGAVYVRAGMQEQAGQSYERAGEHETAARLYEEAGRTDKSITEWARAGQTFKSGQAAARAGDSVGAIALLQKVEPGSDDYVEATRLLAELFVSSGRPELALERVHRVLGDAPLGRSNIGLYYALASAREAKGELREARDLYEKIQAEDLSYGDVAQRVTQLAARIAALPAAPTSSTPAAAEIPPPPVAASLAPPATAPPAAAPVAAPPPAPARAAARPGAAMANLVVREEVGRGPLGVVHRGEEASGRPVALRFPPPAMLARPEVLAALTADIRAASAFSNRHVARPLGVTEVDGRPCIVTELVIGKSLAEPLAAGAKMGVAQLHSLGRAVAQALAAIHAAGLVHGSLQPSNVVVTGGLVKIMDLGLGRLAQQRPAGSVYRAPGLGLDVAGDLYDLATLLYHLLTGVHPRTQPQGAALPLPSTFAPAIPEALDRLLIRCLHPRAELRLPTAEAVLASLKDMVKIG